MKKYKGFWVLATVCCVALLAACAEDDDDFDEPAPSTVDTSVWPLTDYMDTLSFRAGDDFYMYCNGNFWKNTDLKGELNKSFYYDAIYANEERIKQTDMPHKTKLDELAKAVKNSPMTEDEMAEYMAPVLELIDEASTNEDCIKLMARLHKMGYTNLLYVNYILADGVFKPILAPYFYFPTEEESVAQIACVKPLPTRQQLDEHPELTERFHPLANTRSDGSDVLSLLATELGLNPQELVESDEILKNSATYKDTPIEDIKNSLYTSVWALDKPFMDPSLVTESNEIMDYLSPGSSFEDWMNNIDLTCSYTTSYYFATKWLTPQIVEDVEGKCEELRSVFRRRIADLDWMSATTKEKAIRKLDMMTFNVGYPKNWVKEAVVDFDQCQTLVEAARMARKANVNLAFSFLGKDIKSNSFNARLYSWEDLTILYAVAGYGTNSIYIYPAHLLPPMYDLEDHDAIKYARLFPVAHEIIHNFDNQGAKFDESGNYRNWWTVQDRMDFEERYQGLIDCYNRLEMLPWDPDYAGKYCPGEQTLEENIADLGGFELIRQAYIEKCQREGYSGEELDKQERKIYQAYAHLWSAKYTSEYIDIMMFYVGDKHSVYRERINGVVMNTDRWYELYNVQWGDNLYLHPEKRTHIW